MTGRSQNRAKPQPKKATFLLAAAVFVVMQGLVIAQATMSYRNSMLTVTQMHARGVEYGLPFLWHFGMWGDLLIISPICGYVVAKYSHQWRTRDLLLNGLLAFIVSGLMHWTYTFSTYPEAHVQDHRLTDVATVHIVYMGIALTLLAQFLFRTTDIRPHTMTTLSLFLLLHLLLGTHMVLGLYRITGSAPWFPGRPLESAAGWTIIALASLFIICKNLAVWRFPARLRNAISQFLDTGSGKWVEKYIIRFGLEEELDVVEGFFSFLDRFCGRINLGIFSGVGVLYYASDGSRRYYSIFLIIVIGVVYWLSRRSVYTELRIAKKLFPAGRIPKKWGTPEDWIIVTLRVAAFMAAYALAAWFAGNLIVVSIIMMVIALNDYWTRRQIGEGLIDTFRDPDYTPKIGEPDYAIIFQRRDVITHWLRDKPHLGKEAARIIGCGAAYFLALTGHLSGNSAYTQLSYWILILTLIGNEVLTGFWRLQRFQKLDAVDHTVRQLKPTTTA